MVASLALVACASSPTMRAAEDGDYGSLRSELLAREKAGAISNRAAAEVARIVAAREVRTAKSAEATARVREVRACAYAVDDVLAERMKTEDQAGAEAALARIDDGRLDPDDARHFSTSAEDDWRAVGVRGLTRSRDGAARLHALLDPSPHVRRAAIRAIAVAKDVAAVAALFEAARVDPEPLVRTDAVRAIANVAPPREDVALRLRDLWTKADDPLREDIAGAWASPTVFALGGHDALRTLLAAETGPGVIAAAAAVLRTPHDRDQELLSLATAVLVRAITSASPHDRLHAIAVAPLEGELRRAVDKASTDDDLEVRVGAMARLLVATRARYGEANHWSPYAVADAHAFTALDALYAIAYDKDRPGLSARARFALASVGDRRVQAWLEADLVAPDPSRRLLAIDALAALGMAGRGAPLLADADPSVRTRAACTILLAARAGR
jgi:hypothetical protein